MPDPRDTLCQAIRDFLDDWKQSIQNLVSQFDQPALLDDLHQLSALVGAWERSKDRDQHIQRAHYLQAVSPNLSIVEALTLTEHLHQPVAAHQNAPNDNKNTDQKPGTR